MRLTISNESWLLAGAANFAHQDDKGWNLQYHTPVFQEDVFRGLVSRSVNDVKFDEDRICPNTQLPYGRSSQDKSDESLEVNGPHRHAVSRRGMQNGREEQHSKGLVPSQCVYCKQKNTPYASACELKNRQPNRWEEDHADDPWSKCLGVFNYTVDRDLDDFESIHDFRSSVQYI